MVWAVLIPLIAAGLHLASLGAELLLHDRERAKELKLSISKKQKEFKQLKREGKTKEALEVQKELLSLTSKQMKMSFKPTLISLPMFFIVFWLLNGVLVFAPIYTGQPGSIGVEFLNTGSAQCDVQATLVPKGDLTIIGNATQSVILKSKDKEGNRDVVWWEVKAQSPGEKSYQLLVGVKGGANATKDYKVNVVSAGELFYSLAPDTKQIEVGDVRFTPAYKQRIVTNLGGVELGWTWYYILSFFIISLLMSPLKNKVLWGHWEGFKRIERQELEKQNDKTD